MIPRQRCCAHCPGNPISSLNREKHECNVPTYVSGNLKLSSLKKSSPGEAERRKRLQKKATVEKKKATTNKEAKMFSIAKKFHAENLQHQPLPDRVDDRIFANSNKRNGIMRCGCMQKAIERCQNILPQCPPKILQSPEKKYGPELGCKQPESNMDLAICWEIPVNPVYEPRKPTHVDGSNGGAAPSIFTLIKRNPNASCGCIDQFNDYSNKNLATECCLCCKNQDQSQNQNHNGTEKEEEKNEVHEEDNSAKENEMNPSHELCRNLDSISISKHVCGKHSKPIYVQNGRRSKYSRQLRPCAACDDEKTRDSKVRIQSANYYLQRINCKNDKRSGLPPKGMLIPRPRTPFARRSFCIDTLAPPFSVVTGSRDADYPEHWRLTSIYQQSYKNPKKQRGTIMNYHHHHHH